MMKPQGILITLAFVFSISPAFANDSGPSDSNAQISIAVGQVPSGYPGYPGFAQPGYPQPPQYPGYPTQSSGYPGHPGYPDHHHPASMWQCSAYNSDGDYHGYEGHPSYDLHQAQHTALHECEDHEGHECVIDHCHQI
jgi:hypothetical protein